MHACVRALWVQARVLNILHRLPRATRPKAVEAIVGVELFLIRSSLDIITQCMLTCKQVVAGLVHASKRWCASGDGRDVAASAGAMRGFKRMEKTAPS